MATLDIGRAVLALIALAAPSAGLAQTMSTNSATFNAGWNRTTGSENRAVDPSMADANGNLVVVNGLIQGGSSSSAFSNAGGAATAFAGVGGSASASASASAIGNNLNVVVQGNNNTVVVNSTQTNTGNVTATTSANGNP
ncbi:holdfast anchoring protein HfaA [Phenylobacterium montanum]|uniref:Holdfast anchoring protein HfaA n=1 Tax=Phenylobacterium montanum TaxID=2823693 RepID=A0A975G2U9_9CAUL|nr:holdfast anchoring protein HfaA [Caulobacter sp. S6]QUD89875.1 holdfast anchoring protein HfaA [Caulobacter sp. S6]